MPLGTNLIQEAGDGQNRMIGQYILLDETATIKQEEIVSMRLTGLTICR